MTSLGAIELVAGAELPAREIEPLGERDFVRFAGASGDFNPMHYDTAQARQAGYDDIFAMGVLVAALLAQHLAALVGTRRVRSYAVRFSSLVFAGQPLSLRGEVMEINGDLATLKLRAVTPDGTSAVTATAQVSLSPDE